MSADDATMLPPGATATLDKGEAVVTTEPSELVLVMMAAGAFVEVVIVSPLSLVVVI